jgi:hypothetical protein
LANKPDVEPIFSGKLTINDLPQVLEDAKIMQLASEEGKIAMARIEQSPLPKPFIKIINWMVDFGKMGQFSALMNWQEMSQALHQSRLESK